MNLDVGNPGTAHFHMASQTAQRSIVVVVGAGGTIAARGTSKKYNSGVKSIRELTDSLSLAGQDIRPIDHSFGDSVDKTDRDHIGLATYVQAKLADEGVCGVVVTHGTDTLPELAAFMSCILKSEKPVVITGAIRPPAETSADGFANLEDAIAVAQQGYGRGCMVVFQREILSGMCVFKSDIKSLNAFSAARPGQLGFVDAHKAHFYHPPAAQVGLPMQVPASFEIPSVEVFFCHSSFPVDAVRDSIRRGVQACVFVAFGDGYWATGREAIAALLSEHKVPSVITSQSNGCFVGESNAGFGIPGGWLRPAAARALLMLCLIGRMGRDEMEGHIRKRSRQGDPGATEAKL
ncbi:hypothetical protein CDV31_017257 [Fusarium ambrosium]|uniref:asparaginase n=1 Tax=Fusarium ambrosium TaxID=131363 RepID=A0A428RM40_9HYPO|nr:hypothetical protein CDV31_017257 [Fusarium ambrosium]